MAKQLHTLSARTVATLTTRGRHSDGGGLYLNITASGARSWVFMWKVAGKRREMGLGSLRDVPLAKARERAAEARQKLADGLDPIATRHKPKVMTFGEAADALIDSMASSWRNEKHRAQWKMTLSVYCEPLRSQSVAEAGTEDVLKVLQPLWKTKPETASRLRGRIERVFDFARARGRGPARTRPGGGGIWMPFCPGEPSSREGTTRPCPSMRYRPSWLLFGSGRGSRPGLWSSRF